MSCEQWCCLWVVLFADKQSKQHKRTRHIMHAHHTHMQVYTATHRHIFSIMNAHQGKTHKQGLCFGSTTIVDPGPIPGEQREEVNDVPHVPCASTLLMLPPIPRCVIQRLPCAVESICVSSSVPPGGVTLPSAACQCLGIK